MSMLLALSISTGLFCGIWALISYIFQGVLITWIGFAGCTAYFASGKHKAEGVSTAIFSTFSGVASAVVAVGISSLFNFNASVVIIMTAIISCTMCLQSINKYLWFIPGAFIGCFSSFAYLSSGANLLSADITKLVISLLCGSILALSCDMGGEFLFKLFNKNKDN